MRDHHLGLCAGLGGRRRLLQLPGRHPRACVWDRGELTHKVNLFDLQQKYFDVLELDEVVGYLDGLEPGLFDAEFPAVRDVRGAAR